jgi:hypothetical protein
MLAPERRLARRGPALVLAGGALLAAYAALVEPFWVELTRHEVEAPVRAPVTVAHLTDLHTHGLGRRERAVVALLERERPDLVVVTGDSVVNGDPFAPPLGLADDPSYRAAGEVLARLRAPLGVWAVRGNWENLRRVRDERAFYAAAGVRLLVNESARVRDDLWLVGLDDADSGVPDAVAAERGVPPGAARLTLLHSPAFFDSLPPSLPLALAGHTHGGQVRLPGLPPAWLPSGSGRYVAGWYARGETRMYVSRGVGTSTLPVRFACRPEVALLTLVPRSGR